MTMYAKIHAEHVHMFYWHQEELAMMSGDRVAMKEWQKLGINFRGEVLLVPPPVVVTTESFILATGEYPENDDLERSNCLKAGTMGHECCGWHPELDQPVFYGSTKVPKGRVRLAYSKDPTGPKYIPYTEAPSA